MKVLPAAILSWLLFGSMGTLSAIWALRCVGHGEYPTAIATVGVSAFCFGLIIPFVKVVRGNVTAHGTFDGEVAMPPVMRFWAPFMSGLIVLTGAPVLWRNVRRGSTKFLRLTPDGFELAQGWRSQSGDWAEVEGVSDAAHGQAAPTPNAIVVSMCDGGAPTMAAASFTPGGVALRELVRFYWRHPAQRVELTDGRALKRLNEEQFDADAK